MSNPDDKVILAITNIKENTLASAPNNINNIVAQDTTSKNVSAAIQGGNNIIVTFTVDITRVPNDVIASNFEIKGKIAEIE